MDPGVEKSTNEKDRKPRRRYEGNGEQCANVQRRIVIDPIKHGRISESEQASRQLPSPQCRSIARHVVVRIKRGVVQISRFCNQIRWCSEVLAQLITRSEKAHAKSMQTCAITKENGQRM